MTWTRIHTETGRAVVSPPYRIAASSTSYVARGLAEDIAPCERPSAVESWCAARGIVAPSRGDLAWVRGVG